ncbi:MAG: hypothetical protein B7Z39_00335 [Novosphingobium sp. 12-64-8]|nr:MAG: hypothetical protein B7Z39_00335 [Novosphingobium sp. 12-64-8]
MKRMMIAAIAGMSLAPVATWAQQAETSGPVAASVPVQPAAVEPVAAPASPPPCELHVFPTLEGQAVTTGWLVGFGVVGALADASSHKDKNISEAEYLKEALGPRLQIESLKSIDPVAELGLPAGTALTFETPIADRNITTKATNRLTSSTGTCYVELIITQNFYQKRAIYGRSLNNRYVFKDFRIGKSTASLVKGRGGNGLEHFPPKTTDETEAAETELRTVFAKNFTEFAKGMKPSK